MNKINRIKIENIKGKSSFEVCFTNFVANQPNIVVAPNGYGKSTMATAFNAAQHGKIKLAPADIYQQDSNKHPKLEIELEGTLTGNFVASDTEGNISSNISLKVIKSPLYAKSLKKRYVSGVASTAELRIEDIVVYSQIPKKCLIDYSYSEIKKGFEQNGKLFLNISKLLLDVDNIRRLREVKRSLDACIKLKQIKNCFGNFLSRCPKSGTIGEIKRAITPKEIDTLQNNNTNIATLFDCINKMDHKPEGWLPVDVVFTAIQLCRIYATGGRDILKDVEKYLEYKAVKETIDNRLADFNTTGRTIKTREDHGKLIVSFERAESLSNGERDILSFIVNITKYEYSFNKTVGILVIDEVFDYLDGSNMLAVQYYLTELIKNCKAKRKVFFPIIFTHLDPAVFSNYYFKKRKIHYILAPAKIVITSDLVKMLRLRENGELSREEKQEIEKYYLHYIDEDHTLGAQLAQKVTPTFSESNSSFRRKLYTEVTQKYLTEINYDPVMVIAGLRIKIEEIVFKKISPEDQEEYINAHKLINKLNFAVEKGIDVPELFFLLQPLYNDGLHLGGNDEAVCNKIKSIYLKTYNLHIRRMIQKVFQ